MRPDDEFRALGQLNRLVLAQQRKPQARTHQAFGSGHHVGFDDLVGSQPLPRKQSQQQRLNVVLRWRCNPRHLRQIAPPGLEHLFAHEGRCNDSVLLRLQRQRLQLARHVGADVERALQRARHDLLAQILREAVAGFDFQQRQRGDQGAQQGPEAQRIRIGHRSQQELTGDLALQLLGPPLQIAGSVQHLLRVFEQRFARAGQADAARLAIEQRYAQLLLKGLDLRGDRGLGDVQRLCGARHAAQCGGRYVGAQLVHLHAVSLTDAAAVCAYRNSRRQQPA